ncbi:hypothetical protein [Kocuria tytonis]|uniref:Uncharacterized protein n=1 Tax=Kocuria tytonis TaxID=2054280 RepID=A0A495A8Z7_9MICC|nr:hypothetical protein [Kocuria tytonis]RKQ36519.1 hypothetical protein C1C97_002350 [Kocuria tytonis]
MSTPPHNTAPAGPNGPWSSHPATGEHERISPPAPMIELDTPQQSQPVKPLGPRRLARLQREMAEHAREIQESQQGARPEDVDEALLAKQHRLADLAVRAAAANERDRRDAARALAAQPAASEPSGTAVEQDGAPDGSAPGPGSGRLDVAFPAAVRAHAGGVHLTPSHADPASLPASPVHYGPVTETTRIPVQVLPERSPAGDPATGHRDTAAAVPVTPSPASGQDTAVGTDGGTTPSAADRSADAPAAAPAEPVRAVDAEGLELLEPAAYTRGSATTRVLLALLLVVVAALAAVLIIFIL